jgi:hypothetical protein
MKPAAPSRALLAHATVANLAARGTDNTASSAAEGDAMPPRPQ